MINNIYLLLNLTMVIIKMIMNYNNTFKIHWIIK